MDQPNTTTNPSSSDLGIESLLKAAFARTKDRILPYILTYIMSFFIGIIAMIVVGLIVGINALVWTLVKSIAVSTFLGVVSSLGVIVGFIYIGSWLTLATLYSLISPKKLGVIDIFKAVRPMVWSYYLVMLLTTVFIFGLLPYFILSFGIVAIVWWVWGMFLIFVFIEKREGGLKSLFMSKAIASAHFWGILLRSLMIFGVHLFIIYVLAISQAGSKGNSIVAILFFLYGIVAGPFITSYFYEMYKNLKHPAEVGSNKLWIILSIIGWVLMIVGSVAVIATASSSLHNLMNSSDFQKTIKMLEENPESFTESNMEFETSGGSEAEFERMMEEYSENGTGDEQADEVFKMMMDLYEDTNSEEVETNQPANGL